jgi:hypothetical protein
MSKLLRLSTLLLTAAALVLAASCTSSTGSPDLWLQDFEKLKSEMAAGYANLEWAARHHRIDLARLSRETEEKLLRTRSSGKARKILIAFLESFHDPHLRAERSDPPQDSPTSGGTWIGPRADASAREALQAFGYSKSSYDFAVDFEALDGFEAHEVDGNPFPSGVLGLEDGRKLGVIRIQYFGEDRYYDVAAHTWEEFKEQVEGTCDSGCWWPYTLQVRTRLMEHLQTRLRALQRTGVDAILVDITGNGGGSEWCEDVAQLFTPVPLRPAGTLFVKHDHWSREIAREIGRLDEDLARDDLPAAIREILEESRARHEDLLGEVRSGCDATKVWTEAGFAPGCERLAADEHGHYEISEGAGDVASTLSSEHILFRRPRHPAFVGIYDGPLFITIDDGTASASEQFATLLQYNEAATIIGETSYGAGCGYTRGGIQLYLENVQLRVWMPDCVRLRADGENELAGIVPDVAGWKEGKGGKARARELMAVLEGMNPW